MNHPEFDKQWVLIGDRVTVAVPSRAKNVDHNARDGVVMGIEYPDPKTPSIVRVAVLYDRKPNGSEQLQWVYLHRDMIKPSELLFSGYVMQHHPRNGK